MKKVDNKSPDILTILILSCAIYSVISVLINLICSLSIKVTTMLQLWACVIIFAISFIFATIFAFKKKIRVELSHNIIYSMFCFYTVLSALLSAIALIIPAGTMLWCLYSMLLVIAYSLIISLMRAYLKVKNYLISALIYYGVSLITFMILTNLIAQFNEGNQTMIFFGSFSIAYLILAVLYFYIKRSFERIDNEEKSYKQQFD